MFVNQRAWGIVGKVGGSIINKWISYVSRQSSSNHAVPSTEEHRTVRDSRMFLIAFNEIISLREQSVNKKKEKGGNEKCMRDAKDQSTASTAACVDSLEKGKKKSKDIIDGWLRHERSKPIDGCIQQYDDRRRGIIKHTRSIASCTLGTWQFYTNDYLEITSSTAHCGEIEMQNESFLSYLFTVRTNDASPSSSSYYYLYKVLK